MKIHQPNHFVLASEQRGFLVFLPFSMDFIENAVGYFQATLKVLLFFVPPHLEGLY
jgi:hypothetical protein